MRDNVGKVIFISVGMIILVILGILIFMTKKERDAQDTTYESFSWNTGVTTVATTRQGALDQDEMDPEAPAIRDETDEVDPGAVTVPTSEPIVLPPMTN